MIKQIIIIFYILFTVITGLAFAAFDSLNEPLIFDINRPFYYYIRYNKETSSVSLFEGRVNMPEV